MVLNDKKNNQIKSNKTCLNERTDTMIKYDNISNISLQYYMINKQYSNLDKLYFNFRLILL